MHDVFQTLQDLCFCGSDIAWAVLFGAVAAGLALVLDFAAFTRDFPAHAMKVLSLPASMISLSLPTEGKLIFAVGGIYVCYLSYGVLQEAIYGAHGFEETMFLLLVQCAVNLVAAGVGVAVFGRSESKPGPGAFYLIGPLYITAMCFSNESLKFLNYPSQVLGKSCKMLPVMVFGWLHGRQYNWREWANMGMITAGIVVFRMYQYTDERSHEHSSWIGLLLLFGSLCLDGMTAAQQDRTIGRVKPTTHELMFYCNFWALIVCVPISLINGHFMAGWARCVADPVLLIDLLLFALVSALGQNFIFYTLNNFNALVLSTVTTTRKFFTLLFSCFWYQHHIALMQWMGVVLVFGGLIGELLEKRRRQQKRRLAEAQQQLDGAATVVGLTGADRNGIGNGGDKSDLSTSASETEAYSGVTDKDDDSGFDTSSSTPRASSRSSRSPGSSGPLRRSSRLASRNRRQTSTKGL